MRYPLFALALAPLAVGCSGPRCPPDLLGLNAEQTYSPGDAGKRERYYNWFRTFDPEKGVWVLVNIAGGPHKFHTARADAEAYLRRTDRGRFRYVEHRKHANLWVLDFALDPPPPGVGRLGNTRITLWHDAASRRVLAENRE